MGGSHACRVIASRKHSGEKREMKIAEARPIIEDMTSERLISDDAVPSPCLCPSGNAQLRCVDEAESRVRQSHPGVHVLHNEPRADLEQASKVSCTCDEVQRDVHI